MEGIGLDKMQGSSLWGCSLVEVSLQPLHFVFKVMNSSLLCLGLEGMGLEN